MPTILAKKATCGWCGKPDTNLLCQCRQVSFCSKECQVKALDSHKVVCSAGKDKPNKLKEGDIVEISGLTSQRGSRMNGVVAEVQGPDPQNSERLVVLFSKSGKLWEIEQVSISKSNLSLQLGVHEAVRQAIVWQKENKESLKESNTYDFIEREKEAFEDANAIVNSGEEEEIIKAIQQGDSLVAAMLGVALENMDVPDVIALLNAGLIDACLNHFHYPLSIDGDAPRNMKEPRFISVPLASIIGIEGLEEKLYQDLVPKLGPLILLACGKKKRLFHSTEYWACANIEFLRIISQLMMGNPKGRREVFKLPKYVVSALLNHMVLLLTVNPMEMVRTTAGFNDYFNEGDTVLLKGTSLTILSQIVQDPNHKTEAVKIAMAKMAAGSNLELAGKPFASCILDVFALHGVEYPNTGSCAELQHRSLFGLLKIKDSGRFPELQAVMDEDDRNYQEFLAISDVKGSSYDEECYKKWCKNRCARKMQEQNQHS